MTWHPLNHEQKIDCLEVEKCSQYVQKYMLFECLGLDITLIDAWKLPYLPFRFDGRIMILKVAIFNTFYQQIFMLSSNLSSVHILMWKVTFLLIKKMEPNWKCPMRFGHLFYIVEYQKLEY